MFAVYNSTEILETGNVQWYTNRWQSTNLILITFIKKLIKKMHLSLGDQQNFKFKEHNTPSIPNYKALSTNLCSLRKIINLLNHIKYVLRGVPICLIEARFVVVDLILLLMWFYRNECHDQLVFMNKVCEKLDLRVTISIN